MYPNNMDGFCIFSVSFVLMDFKDTLLFKKD